MLLAGGTVVNCNPLYTVHELTHIIGNAGADLIVTLDLKQIFDKAEALVKAGHCQADHRLPFPAGAAAAQGPALPHRQAARTSPTFGARRRANRRVVPQAGRARPGAPPGARSIATRDVAVQQYTGGTTGLPKGAMLSHANIAANMSQIDAWGCGIFYPPSKVVAVLPFFHIFAMTVCMNVPLCNGTQVVMLPRFELAGFLELLETHPAQHAARRADA